MNLGRVIAIASNVFRETVREQVLYLVLLFTLVLVGSITLLPHLAAGGEDKLTADFGLAAIELFGLIVAAFVGSNLINKEIEKRTVFILVAKPISRVEFILGKHLGISAVLAVLVAIMSAIFIGFATVRNISVPSHAVIVSGFFTFWQLMLLSAFAILFGTFTSSLLATMLTLATYVVGNFSRDLLALGEISKSESFQAFARAMYLVLPDLSRANLKNEAVYGILPSITDLLNNGVYTLSYALLVLAIAILVFANRQF
jgi:ABC-type transport system involved in multi-copper enzyme maturation permease subunit